MVAGALTFIFHASLSMMMVSAACYGGSMASRDELRSYALRAVESRYGEEAQVAVVHALLVGCELYEDLVGDDEDDAGTLIIMMWLAIFDGGADSSRFLRVLRYSRWVHGCPRKYWRRL
jgi:hypothetical protein